MHEHLEHRLEHSQEATNISGWNQVLGKKQKKNKIKNVGETVKV